MDDQGYVSLETLARFNRVRSLSQDIDFIFECIKSSSMLEIKQNLVRRIDGWKKWVMSPSPQSEGKSLGSQFEMISGDDYDPDESTHIQVISNHDNQKPSTGGHASLSPHDDQSSQDRQEQLIEENDTHRCSSIDSIEEDGSHRNQESSKWVEIQNKRTPSHDHGSKKKQVSVCVL